MNITRLNFKEVFPYLLSTISDAHFVALDFEMSGIVSTQTLDPSLSDSIPMRYYKTKCKAERFIPVQLGICPIRIEPTRVVYSPFNIYLYPLALSDRDAEQFSFNSESMKFLAKNNFDFNRLFYEGVPFISRQKIKTHQLKLQQLKQKQQQTKEYMLQSPGVSAFLNLKLQQVVRWISTEQTKQENKPEANKSEDVVQINQKQMLVDIQFVRLRAYESLIYLIGKKFPSISLQFSYLDASKNIVEASNFLARKYLRIRKITPEEQAQVLQKKQTKPEQQSKDPNDIENQPQKVPQTEPSLPKAPVKSKRQKSKSIETEIESLALNEMLETIKTKKIPLVVHNGFLDLMHLYHRFIDNLPNNDDTYSERISSQFPFIYDTNPTIFNQLNRDTSLGNCYKILRTQQLEKIQKQNSTEAQSLIKSQISAQCGQYKFDEQEHHEAGYDALMTAYTFVNSMKLLRYAPDKLIQPQFHITAQYYGNKVPLGNIRHPFNFAGKNEEYQSDGGKQFYFTCLQSSKNNTQLAETFLGKQVQMHNHFSKKFGPVKIIWEDRRKYNFTLSFLRNQDELKFAQSLDNLGYGLYSLDENDRYLVSTSIVKEKQLDTAHTRV